MASVNIENARSAASAINKKTERLDELYRSFDKLISAVQTGWNGTGSEDYVYRLQILKNGLADIVRNTSDIAAILNKAANDAEEFDRKASEIFGGSSNPYGYASDRWHINADGSYHINFDCGIMCQGTQQFTHGENPWVECTSTALAQCNNINGGEFKSANDYNDGNGHTQIGFVIKNLDGDITDDEFRRYKQMYSSELDEIRVQTESNDTAIQTAQKKAEQSENKAELLRKYGHITELSRAIADDFIDRITVGEPDESGERKVNIMLKI